MLSARSAVVPRSVVSRRTAPRAAARGAAVAVSAKADRTLWCVPRAVPSASR
jgi:hypothetical protein